MIKPVGYGSKVLEDCRYGHRVCSERLRKISARTERRSTAPSLSCARSTTHLCTLFAKPPYPVIATSPICMVISRSSGRADGGTARNLKHFEAQSECAWCVYTRNEPTATCQIRSSSAHCNSSLPTARIPACSHTVAGSISIGAGCGCRRAHSPWNEKHKMRPAVCTRYTYIAELRTRAGRNYGTCLRRCRIVPLRHVRAICVVHDDEGASGRAQLQAATTGSAQNVRLSTWGLACPRCAISVTGCVLRVCATCTRYRQSLYLTI